MEKIVIPDFGSGSFCLGILMRELGIEYIRSLKGGREALLRGSAIAPDEICLPFKIMLGNFVEGYEKGGRLAVMPSSAGPCRLGEYSELLASILNREGYLYKWIVISPISEIGIKEFFDRILEIQRLTGYSKGRGYALRKILGAIELQRKIDFLEDEIRELSGWTKSSLAEVLREFRGRISKATSLKEGRKICRDTKQLIEAIKKSDGSSDEPPLRIILTGEIYSLVEPFANHHIESLLMNMGVSFRKRVSISWWMKRTLRGEGKSKKSEYLPFAAGGYCMETVEEVAFAKREGFDGVIQIFPAGCMPEIISKSIFEKIKKDTEIPIVTLIFDEMEGEAGYITRIEAFIDMLYSKRQRERMKEVEV